MFYILNTHVKFHSNLVLFTIRSINLFFMHNFLPQKFKHVIDNITINLWFS